MRTRLTPGGLRRRLLVAFVVTSMLTLAVVGAIVLLAGLYGWALEPSTEPEEHHEAEAEVEV